MQLKGKNAIITGAGRNIGKAIAELLAENGANVVINDVDKQSADAVTDLINKKDGGRAIATVADVTEAIKVEGMVNKCVEEFGSVDILVNNVSYADNKTIMDITEEEWDKTIDITLKGTFLCTKYTAIQMIDKGQGGAIVNIVSTSGHRGNKKKFAYCTAKGGLLNMTRQLAVDLSPYKIRVNSVTPAKTGTPVGKDIGMHKHYDDILLKRPGRPIDQANAVLFLVSDKADFITGADLAVDGGRLASF